MSILDCNHEQLKKAERDAVEWQRNENSKFVDEEPQGDMFWGDVDYEYDLRKSMREEKHERKLMQNETNKYRNRMINHQLKIRCR